MWWLLLLDGLRGTVCAACTMASIALFAHGCRWFGAAVEAHTREECELAATRFKELREPFVWCSCMWALFGLVPSAASVQRAYVLSEGAKVVNAETARHVMAGVVERVDRVIGLFDNAAQCRKDSR